MVSYIVKLEEDAWLNGRGSSGYTTVQNYAKVFMSVYGAKLALTEFRNVTRKNMSNAEILEVKIVVQVVGAEDKQ